MDGAAGQTGDTTTNVRESLASGKWKVWMRMWIHCPDCHTSWFHEVGDEPTCSCKEVKA